MPALIQVAIIGAGPAGLFAAEKLAQDGFSVALFNRDIKPGGMAEYGIYPEKHNLKDGLRRQFERILANENVHYFGNVCIGQDRCITIPQLLEWGFPAVLISCGAQGTKWLGIPGENLAGIFHAKDLVFHYNRLPPFSTAPIEIGRRVVVVGAGNVMADVTRYLLGQTGVEEIHICVRRGPAEVKFTQKELESIIAGLDFEALAGEFTRVTPLMASLGQDPEAEMGLYLKALEKSDPVEKKPVIKMHFLVSPIEIQGDGNGKVNTLVLEDNTLVSDGQSTSARGLGTRRRLDVDTVVFAIGDKVEEQLGVPLQRYEYRHTQDPVYPVEGQSYEIEDPRTGKPWKGMFVAGWSRMASSGLVGNAKKDGVNAAAAIMRYLSTERPDDGCALLVLEEKLADIHEPVVRKADLERLVAEEHRLAGNNPLESVKFLTNEEMLKVMGLI